MKGRTLIYVCMFVIVVILADNTVLSDDEKTQTEAKDASSSNTNEEQDDVTITAEENSKEGGSTEASTEDSGKDKDGNKNLKIFRKLFLQKRSQHLEAVESLLENYDYQKTYQMVDLLLTRMRTVVGASRDRLIEKGFEPGMPFPSDEDTKDALAVILENAGLFGDMALRLPDITHTCLSKKTSRVGEVLKWSITFSQDTGFLDDINTRMFTLASQELEIIPKEPDFFNPYKQDHDFEQPPPQTADKKKKKKSEKKRGPRVTKVEL